MTYSVLIVDDEPWSRKVIQSLIRWKDLNLELAGFAEDTVHALQEASRLEPDIVITDMRMPGSAGHEYLDELHRNFPEIRIIVFSGHDDFSYIQQALRSRAIDYLLKPVDPQELDQSLLRAIASLDNLYSRKNHSPEDIREYQRILRQAEFALSSLNAAAADSALRELESYAGQRLKAVPPESVIREIVADMLRLMKDFLAHFKLESGDRLTLNSEPADLPALFTSLKQDLLFCMESVKQYQRSRGQLNIKEVRDYIDKSFTSCISLESISELFLVSKEHLSRSFKAAAGVTVSDYITRRRMEKAAELIRAENVEIKDAPLLCGYNDLSYFYRVFRKHFGCTPAQLKAAHQ